jgi:L-iditol 2-dehydrogenase
VRQAVILGPDRFSVCDAPRPRVEGPGEAVLKTLASGICSGDLMPWYLARKAGTVFGHEPAGRAVEVAPDVKHLKVGDLVFAHHHAPCLACDDCRRQAFVHCPTWKSSKLGPGGMAEYIRLPADIVANDCFAVNDLTAEQALFIEPLACCVKAFWRIGGPPAVRGRRVGVVGCGVMGLLNIQAAMACGAGDVVAIEPDGERRRAAAAFQVSAVLTPEQARQQLRHALDIVVIGPGLSEVIVQALEYVRPAGSAVLFTPTPTGVLTSLDLGELYFRDVSLVPSYSCGPTDTRQAYEWIRSGLVRPELLITHRFGLEEFQAAFDTARRGGPAIKVIVTFPEGE